jgi:hypothetical protein
VDQPPWRCWSSNASSVDERTTKRKRRRPKSTIARTTVTTRCRSTTCLKALRAKLRSRRPFPPSNGTLMMTNEEWQTFFLEDGWCVTTPNGPTCVEQAPVAALQWTSYTRFWTDGFLFAATWKRRFRASCPTRASCPSRWGTTCLLSCTLPAMLFGALTMSALGISEKC